MIWYMTTFNEYGYVTERSWVRAPPGCVIFNLIKCRLFQGHSCVNLYRQLFRHIYIYIYTWCIAWTILDMNTNVMQNGMQNKISITIEMVIHRNPSWWSRHIRFPRISFGMGLSHWHRKKDQNALAPQKDLASDAWNRIALLFAWIYEKVMRPNMLVLPRPLF